MFKLSYDTQLTPSHQFSSSLATQQLELPLALGSLNSRPIAIKFWPASGVKLPEIYRNRSLVEGLVYITGYLRRAVNRWPRCALETDRRQSLVGTPFAEWSPSSSRFVVSGTAF